MTLDKHTSTRQSRSQKASRTKSARLTERAPNPGAPIIERRWREKITEHRRREKILREHAAIVKFSQDALIGVTLQGMIQSWNPGAERLYGYSAREAIGQPVLNLASAEQAPAQVAQFNDARTGTVVGPIETVRRRKDGSNINVDLTVMPIQSSDGTVVSIAEASRDITDRLRWDDQRHTLLRELNHRV
jgi:two-component system, chemotaxis family, CheB/CheR fusion protein